MLRPFFCGLTLRTCSSTECWYVGRALYDGDRFVFSKRCTKIIIPHLLVIMLVCAHTEPFLSKLVDGFRRSSIGCNRCRHYPSFVVVVVC